MPAMLKIMDRFIHLAHLGLAPNVSISRTGHQTQQIRTISQDEIGSDLFYDIFFSVLLLVTGIPAANTIQAYPGDDQSAFRIASKSASYVS